MFESSKRLTISMLATPIQARYQLGKNHVIRHSEPSKMATAMYLEHYLDSEFYGLNISYKSIKLH